MAALREGSGLRRHRRVAARSSSTGSRSPAVHARPDGMPTAGLVLHPDIGGLRPLFEDMARRLATHGLAVCVIEPFAGSARVGPRRRSRPAWPASRISTTPSRWTCSTAAADLLVVDDDVTRVSVLGFCMGGHYAFKAAVDRSLRRRGRVLRHGAHARGVARARATASIRSTSRREMAPTLAFFGSNDPCTPRGRHRGAARRVERPHRLRDRRRRGRRARLRARPRSRRPPRRRRRPRGRASWVGATCAAQPASDGRSASERSPESAVSQSRAQRAARRAAT